MLNRANTLVNVGYGEDLPSSLEKHEQSSWGNHEQSSFADDLQEENINQCNCNFVNEEMGYLNRKGARFLTKLCGNNDEFREEIINFRDNKELDLELILDKRCKTNTLNTLGNKYLTECITSKDNTND